MKTKITLYNNEHDELELGPFNQGVVLEGLKIIDVATGNVEAAYNRGSKTWFPTGWPDRRASSAFGYAKVFIQPITVEISDETIQAAFNAFFSGPPAGPESWQRKPTAAMRRALEAVAWERTEIPKIALIFGNRLFVAPAVTPVPPVAEDLIGEDGNPRSPWVELGEHDSQP